MLTLILNAKLFFFFCFSLVFIARDNVPDDVIAAVRQLFPPQFRVYIEKKKNHQVEISGEG